MKAHSPRQGTGYGWGVSETGQDKTRQGVGAISIHLLVRFILVLLILATWGSIALGVARHGKLGISTGVITQLGKGVDGGEHTVLTVALKPTSPTASC